MTSGYNDRLAQKLARLAAGNTPRVLDLFAGCGGISLGFARAGFQISAAVEIDETAARTHARNFHPADFARHATPRDITTTRPSDLCRELRLGPVREAIDVLVGGPPCQAYARVGRAKLREVAAHPEAFKIDPRGNLYLRYLEYVRAFEPIALLMENVPDVMSYGGHNVAQEMVETLATMGYTARYSLLNSAFFGVPQTRDRVFLLAYRAELGIEAAFPTPTHHIQLPPGYAGQRKVALRLVDLLGGVGYSPPHHPDHRLPPAITAEEAIGDLPPINGAAVKRGARHLNGACAMLYQPSGTVSAYVTALRRWPCFHGDPTLIDHVIRCLPRDGRIFSAMPEGAEYPVAHAIAEQLFIAEARRLRLPKESSKWLALRASTVPPYDPRKFANRWWKLKRDQPIRTLMAHIGKDTYSHIHYDSAQARTISVREAARLQSFPDGFRFEGAMNSAFRQIGNSVPPLVAHCFAQAIAEAFERVVGNRRGQKKPI